MAQQFQLQMNETVLKNNATGPWLSRQTIKHQLMFNRRRRWANIKTTLGQRVCFESLLNI